MNSEDLETLYIVSYFFDGWPDSPVNLVSADLHLVRFHAPHPNEIAEGRELRGRRCTSAKISFRPRCVRPVRDDARVCFRINLLQGAFDGRPRSRIDF